MGGKKHKKKTYTKPKKIKHKHKKVKLAVLKFYDVHDGKLRRLRIECPNEECGAGHFMADHFDRLYCGKCGLTYKKREWDWRLSGILNPTRDQGEGQCCYAFATCAQIESLYHLRKKREEPLDHLLTATNGYDRILLSPQDIYQSVINNDIEDDDGLPVQETLHWIMQNGCVLEEDCPYQGRFDIDNEGPRTVKVRIETTVPLTSEEDIIETVKEEGPVAAEMCWINDMKHFRGDGIYYAPENVSLMKENHAVLIVGYGEHVGKRGKLTKFYIIQNSHGTNWGDKGYGKIERSLIKSACAIRGIIFEDENDAHG